MAQGRMLSRNISLDKRVNDLPSDQCRLGFTWSIAHLDRDGRVHGDPAILKSLIFPRRDDITVEDMLAMRDEWARVGLVVLYQVGDEEFLEYPRFKQHQKGMRYEREPASIIPPSNSDGAVILNAVDCRQSAGAIPDDCRMIAGAIPDDCRQSAGAVPDDCQHITEVTAAEVKLREGKRSQPPPTPPKGVVGGGGGVAASAADRPTTQAWTTLLSMSNGGRLDDVTYDLLAEIVAEHGEQEVLDKLKIAATAGKRGSQALGYIKGIFKRAAAERNNGNGKMSQREFLDLVRAQEIIGFRPVKYLDKLYFVPKQDAIDIERVGHSDYKEMTIKDYWHRHQDMLVIDVPKTEVSK